MLRALCFALWALCSVPYQAGSQTYQIQPHLSLGMVHHNGPDYLASGAGLSITAAQWQGEVEWLQAENHYFTSLRGTYERKGGRYGLAFAHSDLPFWTDPIRGTPVSTLGEVSVGDAYRDCGGLRGAFSLHGIFPPTRRDAVHAPGDPGWPDRCGGPGDALPVRWDQL